MEDLWNWFKVMDQGRYAEFLGEANEHESSDVQGDCFAERIRRVQVALLNNEPFHRRTSRIEHRQGRTPCVEILCLLKR